MLQHSPFLERTFPTPVSFSSCAEVTAVMKGFIWIYSPGLITGIEVVDIRRRVRRLSAVKSAHIHRGRWYQWRFWRLRWLWAVIIVMLMMDYRHRCKDFEWIGWQVQIIQAQRYDWELPSQSLWHCLFVGVIIESYDLWFGGCNWGNCGHLCCVSLR